MSDDSQGPSVERVREQLRREEERPEPPRRDDAADPQRQREMRERVEPAGDDAE